MGKIYQIHQPKPGTAVKAKKTLYALKAFKGGIWPTDKRFLALVSIPRGAVVVRPWSSGGKYRVSAYRILRLVDFENGKVFTLSEYKRQYSKYVTSPVQDARISVTREITFKRINKNVNRICEPGLHVVNSFQQAVFWGAMQHSYCAEARKSLKEIGVRF